ncbi:multidrug efflux RND transporter permease subunit AcrB [Cronobacter turicensis]|jgi:multidrug efflux pump|uniref:Efflux pump membrane transporter n=1 Tax=Cronobacter turicensis (strain DSM 18703 / CCUG 55852 / LMG 23827 / z3032) TaxID=693216 RepID=C9XXT5_CROTZ|nr:multidrug efflux RND transporter permease subunit AcrB [Cronobacter turicensis]CBA28742.1 Acriflavine resistance protein B [Cronobacter turicensis z3032]EGT5682044.1 multidrug efflux RND transporter permease subunit [Cronobacter turicensis]EGT5739525.1 multidrug efflux RND transporter permease subunit [Cronobacter turicensis]EKM0376050.1 multidrug efflux RND transporter permease subunit [Cronobacter turicensis]EKM5063324.1 multidrug efflux RND transporter permease subunit [Cronobacter turic
MAKFFIDRPIFAWVIAIIIMLAGGLSIMKLPVAQYPSIAPPAVTINATYPGADAKTVQDTVTQVIEQNMNGIDGLMYMSSTSDSSGTVQITLTFESGTDADIAQVQVQNKLQLAMPLLPQEVQQQGVSVEKSSSSFLMVLGLINTDGSMKQEDIADYAGANIKDPISRTTGVGDVQLFGSQYAMRIWLDPNKLNNFQLTPVDVISAIKAQNAQVAAGQLGGTPPVKGQQLNASIIAQTRLTSAEEFSKILLKVNQDGSRVLLRDVAKVELGGENYDIIARYNGQPAAGLGIKLATGANALDTAEAVRKTIAGLEPFFPSGLKVVYPYDTTPFVKISIFEVVKTLVEAIVLVFLVMYLFLQNFRATLIPTIAVPVVLLGTFAILAAFGYSINTLTMFGMVLAIGLLVDDAIVVVENVERVMVEEGLPPKEATRKSMGQIQGALVGIALVLSAVFIPMAFFGGSTGAIYRQFSITIVSAMVLSVIVALILTPALCATMLKPVAKGDHGEGKKGFFGWFNRMFDKSTHHYTDSVGNILRSTGRYLLLYLLIVVAMAFLFIRLPSSFLPEEDQGVFLTMAQLPAGATQERTQKVLDEVTNYYLTQEKANVNSVFTVNGFGFSGRGQNTGLAFVSLKNWDERSGAENKVPAITGRAMARFSQIKDAMVFAFNLPAIVELGTATGFDFELIDQGNLGHDKLTQARNQLLGEAAQHPDLLSQVRPNGLEDTPQFKIDIDQEKAQALGVSISDINTTLASAWGGSYVNDFIDRGRVKKVYVMSLAQYRMLPGDINNWYVRGSDGQMVPFSAFSTSHWEYGSPRLERYNGLPSMQIQGQAVQGKSTGEAMAMMEQLASKLPTGIGYDWTGMSYQERLSGNQAPALYAISLIVVFLCLAALYESWSIPFSVMLVVPLGVIGALLAASLRGLNNDVYFQVGLLTTIGLSAKNAILIVEFAKDLMEKEGKGLIEATLEAVRMRLRPILMTSLAFILGVMPLVISSGAGSGAQNAVGTGVMGGMVTATILAIFFVPVFFVVVRRRFSRKNDDVEHSHPVEHH